MNDYNPIAYNWLTAFQTWGIVCGLLFLGAAVLAFILQIFSHSQGIVGGIKAFFSSLTEGFRDLFWMSPRRVGAMTILVFRESVRRKTLLVLVVFAICFLFAGWFLSDPNRDPLLRIPIYVTFVLTAISWLILPAVFLLSCWGLPDDIKARSLHTVVTKPVRRSEILVGRILGVTLVGTLVVAVMSVVGFLWLIRALPEVRGMKTRVPVFGEMSFLDREGNPGQGVNVGDINTFRSYIEGDTGARAIWKFTGISPRLLNADGKLLLESKIQGFRTHKGNIERGIILQYTFVNPKTEVRAKYQPFEIAEFRDLIKPIENDLIDDKNHPVKLMTDIVDNGNLTIEVACLSTGQFLGMARPDLFIRARDASFAASFFKAVLCIWLMMVLIIVFAVSASTIVKGPVASFLTGVIIILGVFGRDFMKELVAGERPWTGGGMLESVYRIVTHMNPMVEMPAGPWTNVIKVLDYPLLQFAGRSRAVIPDFDTFQMSKFVAHGYDVPWDAGLLPAIMHTLAFLVPCIVLGYFCLKSRELESK